MIYSFDVFDTCLIRVCGRPVDLFDILGYKILGEESSSSHRMEFRKVRMEAERKAMTISKDEEITIEEIYDNLDLGCFNVDKHHVLQCELELEETFLQPCHDIFNRIREIHTKGQNVLFISDMYLPHEFIKRMLCKHGFWKDGDELYVSSTMKKTKRSGSLYVYIHNLKNCSYANWYHWGDNKISDYLVPKRLGIKANLVHFEFSTYQQNIIDNFVSLEYRLPYRIATLSRFIMTKYEKNIHAIFCADLIAPLFVSFVYRIMCNARKNNIKNIFFLARDSYKFHKIALSLQKFFPDLGIKYLYVSRRSLYFPLLSVVNADTILSVLENVKGRNLIDILEELNVDSSLLNKIGISKKDSELSLCEDNFSLFYKAFSNPIILDAVSIQKDVQKELLFEYFLQSGLASPQKNAIVDLRGTRTCHKMINKILSDYHYLNVYGYYFEVVENRLSIKEAGDYDSVLYDENFNYDFNMNDYRNLYQVMEAYFGLSNHRKTISYKKENGKIYPIFDSLENLLSHISTIHLKVVEDWVFYYEREYFYLHNDKILEYFLSLLLQFSNNPNSLYLKALNDVEDKSDGIFIVKKLKLRDYFLLLKNRKRNRISWLKGSLYFSIPFFHYLYNIFLKLKRFKDNLYAEIINNHTRL